MRFGVARMDSDVHANSSFRKPAIRFGTDASPLCTHAIGLEAGVLALQVRNPNRTRVNPMCRRAIRFAKGQSAEYAEISTLQAGKSMAPTCSP